MTVSTPEHAAVPLPFPVTHHRTNAVDGVNIFYRQAGPEDAPVVLLLHGFPTSSHMFRNLIPYLADRYHVIAPDIPVTVKAMPQIVGISPNLRPFRRIGRWPARPTAVTRYAIYVMDYGAPVGWRLALKHPERITALIVQNGNAYDEGLREFWDPIKKYWADNSEDSRNALRKLFTLETTKFQYTDGVSDTSRISPDNWTHDQPLLDRPGNNNIQLDIFYDYRTNLPLYPKVQEYLRQHQPPTLIVWAKTTSSFRPRAPTPINATSRTSNSIYSTPATLCWRIRPTRCSHSSRTS